MMKAFEKNIRKVEPYVPGEQPQRKVIKLNTNENPYPPAPGVLAAMKELENCRIPDELADDMDELRAAVADIQMEVVMELTTKMTEKLQRKVG